jgi:hypothetical protein
VLPTPRLTAVHVSVLSVTLSGRSSGRKARPETTSRVAGSGPTNGTSWPTGLSSNRSR